MNRTTSLLPGLLTVVFAHCVQPGGATPLADTIRSANRATVEVLVDGQLKGGGAVVDAEGLVITAAHLFPRPGASVSLITSRDERLPAQLLAIDKGHDLALLQVSGNVTSPLPHLKVADQIPPPGSRIFNLSNALRLRATVIDGMVSQDHTIFSELADSNGYIEHFLVSAATPSLSSGGVWIDPQGRIIGLQSGRLNDGAITSGLAIVAPPAAITHLISTRKTASTPDIGAWVWETWTADQKYLSSIPKGTEGLVITWLRKDGPLQSAGLKRLDTILACNGQPVRRRADFLRLIRRHAPGDQIKLTILKQHKQESSEVEVTLECLEKLWQKTPAKSP